LLPYILVVIVDYSMMLSEKRVCFCASLILYYIETFFVRWLSFFVDGLLSLHFLKFRMFNEEIDLEYVFNKTPRKADYITYLAVILFVCILIFELLLVSVLPNKFMEAKSLEAEAAKYAMVKLEDSLRDRVREYEKRVKTGEVKLVSKCLDDIARYLRLNSAAMDRDQVRDVMDDLVKFETVMRGWVKGKTYASKDVVIFDKYVTDIVERKVRIENK